MKRTRGTNLLERRSLPRGSSPLAPSLFPSAAVPPSMSTNLNRIIKGAHPVGPLTGLPTGGCGKPGTATQPWECVPRESIPWKSKRNCPPLHGGGLPRLSRLGKVMNLHPRRREPLSHCMFTMDCRPTAPFSSSLGGVGRAAGRSSGTDQKPHNSFAA